MKPLRWAARLLLAGALALQALSAGAAGSPMLWIASDVTNASRTALVERLGADAGFVVRHFEYDVAGSTPLTAADAAALQTACEAAAMVWIDARHPSIEARLRGLLRQAPACDRPASRTVWATAAASGPEGERDIAAYLRAGGETNIGPAFALARAAVDGRPAPAVPAPAPWPAQGLYLPDHAGTFANAAALAAWQQSQPGLRELPAVAVLVHRYHFVDGGTEWLDTWLRSFRRQGLLAYAVFSSAVGPAELQALLGLPAEGRAHPRVIVLHQLLPRAAELQPLLQRWGTPLLATQPYRLGDTGAWEADPTGLGSADVPFYLAQPESAGAIDPVLVTTQSDRGRRTELVARQADAVVAKARRLIALQTRPETDKRLVAMVYDYPAGGSSFGASFLNVPRSLERVSAGLVDAGYDTRPVAEADWIAGLQPLVRAYYPGADLRGLLRDDRAAAFPLADYRRWFATLPRAVQDRVIGRWGPPESSAFQVEWRGEPVFVIPRLQIGKLSVLPQPPREETLRAGRSAFAHHSKTPLSHHYLATYLWAGQADALIHFGTHGTQEFAPGKSRGLDMDDDAMLPLVAAGHVPVVYPYSVDNLGEALTAKRRGRAVMVSHRTPVFSPAGFNARMAGMHELMHQWETVDAGATRTALERTLVKQFGEHGLDRDLGWTPARIAADFEGFLEILHPYLDTLAQSSQPRGLASFGVAPDEVSRRQTILQTLRKPLIEALGEDIDEAFLIDYAAMPTARPARWLQLALRDAQAASTLDLRQEARGPDTAGAGFVPNHAARKPIDTPALRVLAERAQQLDRLLATEGEMPGLLAALDGRFLPAAYGGDPVRNPDSLPTGRNLAGLDPSRLPTEEAYAVAQALFDDWLKTWRAEHAGRMPERLALSLWAGETLRQQGVLEAQALVALGVRPVWDASGRPQRVRLVPGAALGRPRVDVLLSVTGSYRDQFPQLMSLLDQAVALAAAEPEAGGEPNAVARNTRQVEAELRQRGVPGEQAALLARARSFGNRAGDYGTGIADAVLDDGLQRDDARLGDLFLQRMSQPYVDGRPVPGLPAGAAAEALGAHLRHTDAAVMSRSSNLHGVVSSDDPFQYLGGLSAAARSAGRTQGLDLFVSQVQDSAAPHTESASRAVALEMQSRYLHPGWLAGQKQEGYAGTLQVLKAVQFAWGWQAVSRDTIRSDHWQGFYETLLQDKHGLGITAWMRSHPQAFAQTLERLVQAQRQGYWAADDEARRQVARLYGELTRQAPLAAEQASVRRWVDAEDPPERRAASVRSATGMSVAETDAAVVQPAPAAPPASALPRAGIRLERQPDAPPAVADALRRLLQLWLWSLMALAMVSGAAWQWRSARTRTMRVHR